MAIPTPELLGLYYPSKELTTPASALPDRVVATGSTLLNIVTNSLSEATDFWNGAVGFFCGSGTTPVLRGQTFHVRKWDKTTGTLQIASPIPVAPVLGDTFKLFVGGKTQSSQEVLSMKVSSKQPEVDSVIGTNCTGIVIRKASAMLGEGTLGLRYNASTKALNINMAGGDYGPDTLVSGNMTGVAVFNKDLAGFILVDVTENALKTGTSTFTDTFTLTTPKGNIVPNYEGYETNDGVGRSRYHLIVSKNKSAMPLDAMNALSIWTGKPAGTSTTLSAAYAPSYIAPQTMAVAAATTWPSRGFWIRNKTRNDLRYVDFRSGNTLYTKALDWGWLNFKSGTIEIKQGTIITNTAASPSVTAIVDQVQLTSGSWAEGTAQGNLILKKFSSATLFGTAAILYVNGVSAATVNGTSNRGYRGHVAIQWYNGDVIELASDIDIGTQKPSGGFFNDPKTENLAPDSVTFGHYPSQEECCVVESLLGGESVGLWIRQTILDGTQARQNIEGDLNFVWF